MKVKLSIFLFGLIICFSFIYLNPTISYASDELEIVDVYWGMNGNRVEVSPGDISAPLTVVIRNKYPVSITNVDGRLYLSNSPFSDLSGSSMVDALYLATVQPSHTFELTFRLMISEEAAIGKYSLQLAIDFSRIVRGTYLDDSDVLSFSVDLKGKVDLQLSLNRTLFLAGQVNDLDLIIINKGDSDALDITLKLTVPMPYVFLSDDEFRFEGLPAGSSISIPISIYVPSVAQGSSSSISISLDYLSPYGFVNNLHYDLSFNSPYSFKSFLDYTLDVDHYFIGAGDLNESLVFHLKNNSPFDYELVKLTFSFPSGVALLGRDNVFIFHDLSSRAGVDVPLKVYALPELAGEIVQCSVGVYLRSITGFDYTEIRKIGFKVVGYPDLEVVSFALSPKVISSGSTITISGSLRNEGLSTAKKVSVSLLSDPNYFSNEYSSIYVGSISSDSQAPFSVSVKVREDISVGTYTMSLEVRYSDELDMNHTLSIPVSVTISSSQGQGSTTSVRGVMPGLILPVSISLLFGLVLGYLIFRWKGREKGIEDEV